MHFLAEQINSQTHFAHEKIHVIPLGVDVDRLHMNKPSKAEARSILNLPAQGKYLGIIGRIDPLNYIGPDDIFIPQLLARISKDQDSIDEIILATNPNTEGEATAMYIKKQLVEKLNGNAERMTITRLAYGLPIGAELEFADYMTLKRSLEGRKDF